MSGTTGLHVWLIVIKRMVIRWNTCNPLQLLKMCISHLQFTLSIMILFWYNLSTTSQSVGERDFARLGKSINSLLVCMYHRTLKNYALIELNLGPCHRSLKKNIFIQSALVSAILTHFEKISKIKFSMDRVIFLA